VMDQLQLLANYNTLRKHGKVDPTVQDVLAVAPHLSYDTAADILSRARGANQTIHARLVGPPIAVQGALHVLRINNWPSESQNELPVTLSYAYATRRSVSYPRGAPPATWI
jgi:hypothetical protein